MFSNCNSAVETEAQRFVVSAFFRVFVCSKLGFWRQHHAQARLLFSMAKMEKGNDKNPNGSGSTSCSEREVNLSG